MMIRTTRLPDRAEYFLDAAVDAGEMTIATSFTLHLYGESERICAIIDYEKYSHTRRRLACLALADYAIEIAKMLSPLRRRALCVMAVPHLVRQTIDMAECLAAWAFEDTRTGGAMLPFRRYQRVEADGNPCPKARRKLHSPGWIRHYVKNDDTAQFMRQMALTLGGFVDGPTLDGIEAEQMAITDDLNRQLEWFRQDLVARRAIKPVTRKTRRATIRAAALAATVLGVADVSAFARGHPVILPGDQICLQVFRAGSIHASGHGALNVEVLDRESRPLGRLCVYQDKIPQLDQLAALALHMQSGNETEVIARANITSMTELGAQHPILSERMAKKHTAEDPVARFVSRFERERALSTAYFDATRMVWIEALGVFVLGPRWKGISKIVGDQS